MAFSELMAPFVLGALGDALRTGIGVGLDNRANARADLNNATKIQTAVADAKAAGLSPLSITNASTAAPVVSASQNLMTSNTGFMSSMDSLGSLFSQASLQQSAQDFQSSENALNRALEIETNNARLSAQEKNVRMQLANATHIAELNNATQKELQNSSQRFQQIWNQYDANQKEKAFSLARQQALHEYEIRKKTLEQAGQKMKMSREEWIGDYIFRYLEHFLPSGDGFLKFVGSISE